MSTTPGAPVETPKQALARVFGRNLARERQRQCKSMRALARAANTHGSEISRLEHGKRDPRLSTIVRLARALEVPLGALIEGVDSGYAPEEPAGCPAGSPQSSP